MYVVGYFMLWRKLSRICQKTRFTFIPFLFRTLFFLFFLIILIIVHLWLLYNYLFTSTVFLNFCNLLFVKYSWDKSNLKAKVFISFFFFSLRNKNTFAEIRQSITNYSVSIMYKKLYSLSIPKTNSKNWNFKCIDKMSIFM